MESLPGYDEWKTREPDDGEDAPEDAPEVWCEACLGEGSLPLSSGPSAHAPRCEACAGGGFTVLGRKLVLAMSDVLDGPLGALESRARQLRNLGTNPERIEEARQLARALRRAADLIEEKLK